MILQDEILGRFARQEQLKEDGTTPFPLSAVPTGLLLFPFAYPGFHPVLFPVRAVQIGEAVDFLALVLLDRLRLRPDCKIRLRCWTVILPLQVAHDHLR